MPDPTPRHPKPSQRPRRKDSNNDNTLDAHLEKKRQTDRESQRVVRERTKKYISHLESLVETLQKSQHDERLQAMTAQCKHLHQENEKLRNIVAGITRLARGVEPGEEGSSSSAAGAFAAGGEDGQDVKPGFDLNGNVVMPPPPPGARIADFQPISPRRNSEIHNGVYLDSPTTGSAGPHSYRDYTPAGYPPTTSSPILVDPYLPRNGDPNHYPHSHPHPHPHPHSTNTISTTPLAPSESNISPPGPQLPQLPPLPAPPRNPSQALSTTTNTSSSTTSSSLPYTSDNVFLAVNTLLHQAESLTIPPMKPDIEADIAIRAVTHGWAATEERHELDAVWRIVRQIVEDIFAPCGRIEKLAILRLMRLKILQQITISHQTHLQTLLPTYMHSRPVQTFLPHPSLIDYFVWPSLREFLILSSVPSPSNPSPPPAASNATAAAFSSSLRFKWPFDLQDAWVRDTRTDLFAFSRVFDERFEKVESWALERGFFELYPELGGYVPVFEEGEVM